MDDENREELAQFRRRSDKQILYRVDERTENIDERLGRMEKMLAKNQEKADLIENKANRNSTIIAGVTFIFGTGATALIGEIVGIV